ncbi:hypothetical protein [Undibacterium flavidum]|uniref:TonB family protein n=1 Tax=Undibacterium flavidum TaxID=2762297 RepID=A0ABR6Y9M3_9BURK|nr:hypothetical protein [Undibacterium flavidum]MBC3872874.1 hypothetical protein [Undibacterium flavidum]
MKKLICVMMIAGFSMFSNELYAQSKDGKSISEDAPALGTSLKKKVATSSISMDRSYQELSEEEKEAIRSVYDNMPENDEPPYPLYGTREIHRKMSQTQQYVAAKGVLTMTVDVSSTGEAQSVSIYESPDPDITRVASLVLMETKYKPAVCGGKACKMQYFFQVQFSRVL